MSTKIAYCPGCQDSVEMRISLHHPDSWFCGDCAVAQRQEKPATTNSFLPTFGHYSQAELNEAFAIRKRESAKYIENADKLSTKRLTLPTDSEERKSYPLYRGCLQYFSAALAGVAKVSKLGNDKHNPGQPLHHARGKSTDHADCIIRHLIDVSDLLAAKERGDASVTTEQILLEVSQMTWRALAFSQELNEKLGAPLAPAAKV